MYRLFLLSPFFAYTSIFLSTVALQTWFFSGEMVVGFLLLSMRRRFEHVVADDFVVETTGRPAVHQCRCRPIDSEAYLDVRRRHPAELAAGAEKPKRAPRLLRRRDRLFFFAILFRNNPCRAPERAPRPRGGKKKRRGAPCGGEPAAESIPRTSVAGGADFDRAKGKKKRIVNDNEKKKQKKEERKKSAVGLPPLERKEKKKKGETDGDTHSLFRLLFFSLRAARKKGRKKKRSKGHSAQMLSWRRSSPVAERRPQPDSGERQTAEAPHDVEVVGQECAPLQDASLATTVDGGDETEPKSIDSPKIARATRGSLNGNKMLARPARRTWSENRRSGHSDMAIQALKNSAENRNRSACNSPDQGRERRQSGKGIQMGLMLQKSSPAVTTRAAKRIGDAPIEPKGGEDGAVVVDEGLWGRMRVALGLSSSPPSSDGLAGPWASKSPSLTDELDALPQPMVVMPRSFGAHGSGAENGKEADSTWCTIDLDGGVLTCEPCHIHWERFDVVPPPAESDAYGERLLLRSAERTRNTSWWCEIVRGPPCRGDDHPTYYTDLTFCDASDQPRRGIIIGGRPRLYKWT